VTRVQLTDDEWDFIGPDLAIGRVQPLSRATRTMIERFQDAGAASAG